MQPGSLVAPGGPRSAQLTSSDIFPLGLCPRPLALPELLTPSYPPCVLAKSWFCGMTCWASCSCLCKAGKQTHGQMATLIHTRTHTCTHTKSCYVEVAQGTPGCWHRCSQHTSCLTTLGASFGFCFHEGRPKDLGLMDAKHFQVEKLEQMQKFASWLSW